MPTVTLSSIGTSPAIALDYIAAKATTFSVTASTSGSWNYTVQGTLDDPMRVTSPTWFTLSSAALTATSTITSFLSPLAGVRLNSSVNGGTLTLWALQNAGG
jgi:hypothetical protein